MEVPISEIRKVIFRARNAGCKIILNLAPALKVDDDVLKLCDYLILNAGEAKVLAGKEESAENYARAFFEKYDAEAIVTLGDEGAVLANGSGVYRTKALDLKPIDTVGAGDSFVGSDLPCFWRTSSCSLETWKKTGAKRSTETKAQGKRSRNT